MKRRDFIMGVGGVAAMPLAAHAQAQPATPVIGFLRDTTRSGSEYLFAALSNGLREVGLIEGQDFFIEFGWGEGHRERLPALAADFARRASMRDCGERRIRRRSSEGGDDDRASRVRLSRRSDRTQPSGQH